MNTEFSQKSPYSGRHVLSLPLFGLPPRLAGIRHLFKLRGDHAFCPVGIQNQLDTERCVYFGKILRSPSWYWTMSKLLLIFCGLTLIAAP